MSTKTRITTIQCPKCGQTLPGWAQSCQFCGNTITPGFVRPVDLKEYGVNNRPTWREASYIVVSVLITLEGAFGLWTAFSMMGQETKAATFGTFIGIFAAARCLLGVGMLFHQEWAQFIMKWVCVVGLFLTGFQFLVALMMVSNPHFGWIPVARWGFDFGLNVFTLYLLYTEADV